VALSSPNIILDLHNTGSVTPKVVEISRGAALRARVWRLNIKQAIPRLKENGFSVVGLEAHHGNIIMEEPKSIQKIRMLSPVTAYSTLDDKRTSTFLRIITISRGL